MDDKILVECNCGKQHRVSAEKLGARLKCRDCGEAFVAEQLTDDLPGPAQIAAPDDTESAIDPGSLMSHITGMKFSGTLIMSLVIHVILISVTSIAFVQLCISLGTTDPRSEVQRQEIEQKEKDREQARKDYKAKLLTEQKGRAEQPAEKADGAEDGKESAPSDRPKSPVEKRIEETSDERPKASDMSLDDDLDL